MSETIKVAITADASDFQAAVAKASASADRFERKAVATGRSLQNLGKGGAAGSYGLLAFSQALEDARYGMAAVLNNIPSIVMGFGGSAGLAGAISIAAVAGMEAYKVFYKLGGGGEADVMVKWANQSADAIAIFTAALKENRLETERLSAARKNQADLKDLSKSLGERISKDLAPDAAGQDGYDVSQDAIRQARAAQDAMAQILSGATGTSEQELMAEATRQATTDKARALEDLNAAQAEYNRLLAEYSRIYSNTPDVVGEFQQDRDQAAGKVEELRQQLASKQAQLERALKLESAAQEGTPDRARFRDEALNLKTQINDLQAYRTQWQETVKVMDQAIAKAEQQSETSRKALEAQMKDQKNMVLAAEQALKQREQMAEAEAKVIQIQSLQKQAEDLQPQAEQAAEQTRAANEFADELQIVNAALETSKKQSEELEKQLRLRREAKQLADQTGMSEKDAGILTKALDDARTKADKLPTGTIAERAAARAKERDEERQRKRDEAVQEAARNREERKRQREGSKLDPKDKPVDLEKEADRVRREAAEREKKSREDVNKNIEKQTKLQEEIKELFQKLAAA